MKVQKYKSMAEIIKNSKKITITVIFEDIEPVVCADFEIAGDEKKHRRYFTNLSDCVEVLKKLIPNEKLWNSLPVLYKSYQ